MNFAPSPTARPRSKASSSFPPAWPARETRSLLFWNRSERNTWGCTATPSMLRRRFPRKQSTRSSSITFMRTPASPTPRSGRSTSRFIRACPGIMRCSRTQDAPSLRRWPGHWRRAAHAQPTSRAAIFIGAINAGCYGGAILSISCKARRISVARCLAPGERKTGARSMVCSTGLIRNRPSRSSPSSGLIKRTIPICSDRRPRRSRFRRTMLARLSPPTSRVTLPFCTKPTRNSRVFLRSCANGISLTTRSSSSPAITAKRSEIPTVNAGTRGQFTKRKCTCH